MSYVPSIEISSVIHNFQKRYWWHLSSIVEQTRWNDNPCPILCCKSNIFVSDPSYDMNHKIHSVFHRLVRLKIKIWRSKMARGAVRNKDLKETDCDWLLYSDADMVFHPQFFSHLATRLSNYLKESRVISSWRYTMKPSDADSLVDSIDYESPIKHVIEKVEKIKHKKSVGGKVVGAGYFQLVNVKNVRDKGILYPTGKQEDIFGRTPSDILFRRSCGGVIRENLKPMWHLNHKRRRRGEIDPSEPL